MKNLRTRMAGSAMVMVGVMAMGDVWATVYYGLEHEVEQTAVIVEGIVTTKGPKNARDEVQAEVKVLELMKGTLAETEKILQVKWNLEWKGYRDYPMGTSGIWFLSGGPSQKGWDGAYHLVGMRLYPLEDKKKITGLIRGPRRVELADPPARVAGHELAPGETKKYEPNECWAVGMLRDVREQGIFKSERQMYGQGNLEIESVLKGVPDGKSLSLYFPMKILSEIDKKAAFSNDRRGIWRVRQNVIEIKNGRAIYSPSYEIMDVWPLSDMERVKKLMR